MMFYRTLSFLWDIIILSALPNGVVLSQVKQHPLPLLVSLTLFLRGSGLIGTLVPSCRASRGFKTLSICRSSREHGLYDKKVGLLPGDDFSPVSCAIPERKQLFG